MSGPTASGKTALALALARQLGGTGSVEVVNFDSVQLYRDFDLGTAKPTTSELEEVPHHLIGVADAASPWTAGEYARRARPIVADILRRGKLPILVGGTGFYLRALLDGLSALPQSSRELRHRLAAHPRLHELLRRLDPGAAARIAPGDREKIVRAVEVRLLTRRPVADAWQAAPREPFAEIRALKFALRPERAQLYERIDRRAEIMFSGGIQEETRRLLRRYPADVRIWIAHGYKQACDIVLRGVPEAQALAEAQQEQRRYAKRQWTWLRSDPDYHWLDGFGDDPVIQQTAANQTKAALNLQAD
ncbi:MAG TPA: tRNA (adenosine(37)-N6)-dimethylallyltransferase MiaA [Terriglobales bacterium]|nr:tRNA (adenosine(37)-N6)-dimethylallyltransferase MiaA [Terriglobales bacterium]